MTCYHRMKAFPVGHTETGKVRYKIKSLNDTEVVYRDELTGEARIQTEYIYIPCGQCIGCRIDQSRDWATRMMCELENPDGSMKEAYFITFTYDDEHLVYGHAVLDDPDTGDFDYVEHPTLVQSDFQKFLKRLRKSQDKEYGNKIRYFYCGEYGSMYGRPHYHAVIYNIHLDDLELYKINFNGDRLYNSKYLEQLWPFGWVVVAPVTWETCAYTARYVSKKFLGKMFNKCEIGDLQPEYVRASTHPGLGYDWFFRHFDDVDKTYIIRLSDSKVSRQLPVPRYFKKLYEETNPDNLNQHKLDKMRQAANKLELELAATDLDLIDYLEVQERAFLDKVSKLRRKDPQEGVSRYDEKKRKERQSYVQSDCAEDAQDEYQAAHSPRWYETLE